MFHRFIVFAASMLSLSSFAAMAASISVGTASAPTPVQVIEYYHVGLDHYFVTADAGEISALDGGKFVGWARTGSQFTAYSPTPASVGKNSVCRFYGRPEAGLDSHFYSGAPDECAAVLAKFPSSWMLESGDVFQIEMPDRATGACSATTIPVFRLFNNRLDANHRYTIDINTRNAMLARGYITEGYGPDGVVFCAVEPTTSTPPPSSDPFSVTMLVTQLAADTFDFSSAVALNTAAIVSYNWDFGDGTDATGPTASHRFSLSGTFPVVLTVADSKGAVAKAAKDVAAGTTIVPTPPTPPSSPADDFAARRSAPGVVRWFDFDTPAQLGTIGSGSGNFGIFSNNGNNNLLPVIDTNVKASGSGSLRFDIATIVDTQWYANFSPDLSVRFGANSKFYVQWRQRFNQAMVDTIFLGIDGNDQAGIKQAIIGPGDTAVNKWGSCETIHLVTQTFYQHRFPFLYNSCTGSSSHGAYAGLFATTGPDGATEYYQNARPSCNRTRVVALGPTAHVDVPSGCFGWTANEWLTFQIEIILGPRTDATAGADFANSTVRMWGAREGQASVLLVDWKPGVPGYFPLAAGSIAEDQQYGKIWLLPYMTNGSNTQIHPLAQTWYDELIVSRQPINDPLISKPPPGITVAPAPVSSSGGPYPAWRQGKAVGQWFPIPNTANMGGVTTASTTIDVWNGLGACPTSWWSLAAGGDGIPFNAVFSIELAADKPAWVMKHPSSPPEAYSLTSPYYADGAPVARHTYFSTQCITAAHDRTGIDRVMLFSDFAAYGVFKGGQFGGGPQVDGFRVRDGQWDPAGTWQDMTPFYSSSPISFAKHPITEDVYTNFSKWTAATGLWNAYTPIGATKLLSWENLPSVVDGKRNRLVAVHDGRPYYNVGLIRLQAIDLVTNTYVDIPVTGSVPVMNNILGGAMVHDTDNDRYLLFWNHVEDGTTDVFSINPDTGASTLISNVRPPQIHSMYGRAAYFQQLGGVAYLPSFASNILFMPTR